MSTIDEARFDYTRKCADVYRECFQEHGRDYTAGIATGALDAAGGALIAMKGEAAAYYAVQRLADRIAERIIGITGD